MKAAGSMLALLALALGGCSMSSGLTTGSLLGDDKPAAPVADPSARAFQVGTASARAVKCGFNFDPGKLKANYLAYEKQQAPGQDTAKVERIYDVSFNGVAKAVAAAEGEYCSDGKVRQIKADLTRHLAGDYTPSPPKEEQEEGLFSGWGSGSGGESSRKKVTMPTDNTND